jgi:phospholipase/carboxylesterase
MTAELSFVHAFRPGNEPGMAPLLLLHGTGGDEASMMPLADMLAPGRALVVPRGPVSENGMPRFFRRFAEGVFDLDDLRRRAADLNSFIADARAAYRLEAPVAVGYSNGANIAAALLLLHADCLSGAVLFRAMETLPGPAAVRLPQTPVLLISGRADPIVPMNSAQRLAGLLAGAGAAVRHEWLATGHGLTEQDVAIARAWLSTESFSA